VEATGLASGLDGFTPEERTTAIVLVGPTVGGDFLKEKDVPCL